MSRATVSQRLRARLKKLMKHGDQTELSRWSIHRPGGAKIGQQELSAFMNAYKDRRGLNIDDLDDIADFFNVSIGDLLGDTKRSELSAIEQRLLHSFRALPEPVQEHFLALVESASIAPLSARGFALPKIRTEGIRSLPDSSANSFSPHGDRNASHSAPPDLADPTVQIERLRAAISAALLALTSVTDDPGTSTKPNQVPHRSVPGSMSKTPGRSGVAD